MTDAQFNGLVYNMRQAQKAYFKNRLNRDLQESKRLEREVDDELLKRSVGQVWAHRDQQAKMF